MNWLIAVVIASLPLILGELIFKYCSLKQEIARKTIHILGSLASVLLLYFLNLNQITLLSGIFVIVLLIVRNKKLVNALYDVKRKSYGEIIFPIGVSTTAFIANSNLAYTYGILIMGFSDAFASIVGKQYAKTTYKPLFSKEKKSYIGSLTFFSITFVISIIIILANQSQIHLAAIFLISIILTLIESQLSYGLDNVVVPVVATLLFQLVIK